MSYLLGVAPEEIERLEFQEKVWGWMSRALWDRIGVRKSWRVLDVGAGIGCATVPLAARSKYVVALEPTPAYAKMLRERAPRNVKVVESTIDDFRWDGPPFDLIFCRWVFLFLRDLEPAIAKLARLLAPGGFLAVEDYHDYRALALYPETPSFEKVIAGAKKWFRRHGGDLRVAGRMPAAFRKAGLRTVEFRPNLLAGNGRSDVFRWAGLFFFAFADGMVGPRDAARFRKDWTRAAKDPDTQFLSPLIFDVVGQKP